MALDHALRREESLDLFPQLCNTIVLLDGGDDVALVRVTSWRVATALGTYPHPVRSLRTETKALQTKPDARLARAVLVGLLVAFLGAARRWHTGVKKREKNTSVSIEPSNCASLDASRVDIPSYGSDRCSSPT